MNNINSKVIKFNQDSLSLANAFYKKNSSVKRFHAPQFHESPVQERIMRLGIEARALNATNEDELYMIAITTLHNDYIKQSRELQLRDGNG